MDDPLNSRDIDFFKEQLAKGKEQEPENDPQPSPVEEPAPDLANKENEKTKKLMDLSISPRELLLEVKQVFSQRVSLQSEGDALIVALWIMNTYLYDIYDTPPYLLFDSPTRGCGKTTALKVISKLCSKPEMMNSPSSAVLFRLIDRDHPTLLIDEAEKLKFNSEQVSDLKSVLQSGYEVNGYIWRCEDRGNKLGKFHAYCPKALAAIGGLEGALLDRCIVAHMKRATRGLIPTYSHLLSKDLDPVKEKIKAFSLQYRDSIKDLWIKMPRESYWSQFVGRDGDLNFPLLMIAKLAGEDIELQAVEAAVELLGSKAKMTIDETDADSKNSEILRVAKVMREEGKFVSKDGHKQILVNHLINPLMDEEGAWANMLTGDTQKKREDASLIGTHLKKHRGIVRIPKQRLKSETGTVLYLDNLIKELEDASPIIHQHLRQGSQAVDKKEPYSVAGNSEPATTVQKPTTIQPPVNKGDSKDVVGVVGRKGVMETFDEDMFDDLAEVTESVPEQERSSDREREELKQLKLNEEYEEGKR